MREILFRGRTTAGKEWVSGFYAVFSETPFIGAPNPQGIMLWYEVDPATVGQYTGLIDKDGKRIFEGDIVFAKDDIWGSPFADGIKGKVVYCETAFFIEPKNVMDTEWLFNECAVYEILGNIHDNPEMLERSE